MVRKAELLGMLRRLETQPVASCGQAHPILRHRHATPITTVIMFLSSS